ncbi:MAG: hemin uptake protein HemP [Proteobacteria bacterium]|nr:hemin uptake protein HemP [Pseudomonadota bacterium]
MDAVGHPAKANPPRAPLSDASLVRSIDSIDLLQGGRELLIRHGTSIYKLRVTASEKLILTK